MRLTLFLRIIACLTWLSSTAEANTIYLRCSPTGGPGLALVAIDLDKKIFYYQGLALDLGAWKSTKDVKVNDDSIYAAGVDAITPLFEKPKGVAIDRTTGLLTFDPPSLLTYICTTMAPKVF
jgi:hypothetical protein